MKTILGFEVSTTKVAVIVPWIFGSALTCPLHMKNAFIATVSSLLLALSYHSDSMNIPVASAP